MDAADERMAAFGGVYGLRAALNLIYVRAPASSASAGRPTAIDAKRRGPYTERCVHAGADCQT